MAGVSDPIRVLMAGPMPPAIGGMVSVIRDLCESPLALYFDIDRFDTAKKTAVRRSLATAVAARLRLWREWWRVLGRGPSIAHIHTCSGLSFFLDAALLVIARVRGVPVLLHIHGGQFDAFLDGLDPLRRGVVRVVARRAERVIVLSEVWRVRLGKRLPRARLQVVENGVPIPAATRAVRDPAQPPLVLFVGAVCRAKGLEDLVDAFAQLRPAARLVIVGPETEAGFAADLAARARARGMADRIEFPGPADPASRAEWLARADLFVLPSHSEALPVALLEAMASGLPVIATRVGAIPIVVDDGRSGMLVEARDVEGLAQTLGQLLADVSRRSAMGDSARAACIERFSIDRTAADLGAIYREIACGFQLKAAM